MTGGGGGWKTTGGGLLTTGIGNGFLLVKERFTDLKDDLIGLVADIGGERSDPCTAKGIEGDLRGRDVGEIALEL